MTQETDRRCFLTKGLLGAAGIAAAGSIEERTLLAALQDGEEKGTGPFCRNGPEGASHKRGLSPFPPQDGTPAAGKPKTDVPPGSLPCGKIGRVSLSRLILGGNLIGGWAHSRDLMYASKPFKSYNTEAKIFETLELAQRCGVNTIQIDPRAWGPVLKYNLRRPTKIQTMACLSLLVDKARMNEQIKRVVDQGATLLYPHGGETDTHFMNGGKIDVLAQAVELIKAQGLPAGVGSHSLEVPVACEKNKVEPDFYVKTFHMDRYWSATPQPRRKEYDWMRGNSADHDANNDNMWCNNPEETAAFMQSVARPWVAFKVMAAGAIHPRMAFSYAFRHGADFIMAGMFDFQVEDDVKLAVECVQKAAGRKRPWWG